MSFKIPRDLDATPKVSWAFLVAQVVKNPPPNVGDIRDVGSIPGSGRSCLDNSMDRGAWRATVHGVTRGQTRLSN